MEIDELREQLDRVRTMLQEQRTTLDAMPATECRVFKALHTFILDVLDFMEKEEEDNDEGTLFTKKKEGIGGLGTVKAVVKKVFNRALMRQVHKLILK